MSDHDIDLKHHLEHAKKNATYTSKSIQNEIVQFVASKIRDTIKDGFMNNEGSKPFYTVIADTEKF